eukprot:1549852-Pyramimonas_sp.AAC.1
MLRHSRSAIVAAAFAAGKVCAEVVRLTASELTDWLARHGNPASRSALLSSLTEWLRGFPCGPAAPGAVPPPCRGFVWGRTAGGEGGSAAEGRDVDTSAVAAHPNAAKAAGGSATRDGRGPGRTLRASFETNKMLFHLE